MVENETIKDPDNRRARKVSGLASLLIPAGIVTLLLLALIQMQTGAEMAVANLAGWLPVGYAFAAGMVASVNPCGFMLLPSYLSYHLGTEEKGFYRQSKARRLRRAVLLGGVATAGFLAVLILFGLGISAGGQWLVTVFPYAGVVIGAAMALLGFWLLVTHRTIGIGASGLMTVGAERNLRTLFSYGVAYALGSLSCTLPIFLVVVGSALTSGDIARSLLQFVGYALGMGTVLIVVTIGAALFQGVVARWLRRLVPYVHRMSAMFLMGAGAYLVFYWLFVSGSFL
jgi:cytochrome c biogenesis protein CcdA